MITQLQLNNFLAAHPDVEVCNEPTDNYIVLNPTDMTALRALNPTLLRAIKTNDRWRVYIKDLV